jgi:hypothetical protein
MLRLLRHVWSLQGAPHLWRRWQLLLRKWMMKMWCLRLRLLTCHETMLLLLRLV